MKNRHPLGVTFNAETNGFMSYLHKKAIIEAYNKTLILEERVPYQPNRPTLYNHCLYFNGTSEHTFINSIVIDATNSVDIWIKPSVGFNNYCNVVDSTGQGQMFRFTQLLTSNKIGWYLFSVDDYTTVGTSRTSDLTWDWDNGDWYKLTYVKERNLADNGYILQLKVNDVVAIEYQITDVQLSGLGYSLSWNLGALASTNTNGLHYKGYIHSVTSDNGWAMMFEEGAGTTVYSNSGQTAAITTANINLVRVTQDDAPLLPESGDYVGLSTHTVLRSNGARTKVLFNGGALNLGETNTITIDIYYSNIAEIYPLWSDGWGWFAMGIQGGSRIYVKPINSSNAATFERNLNGIGDFSLLGRNVITITRNGNDYELYVNGIYKGVRTSVDNTGINTIIGGIGTDLSTRQLRNEVIRNVVAVNRVLTQAEVTELVENINDTSDTSFSANVLLHAHDNKDGTFTDLSGNKTFTYYGILTPTQFVKGDSNTDVLGFPLDYSGRKDQPLTVGGVAVNLDATATLDTEDCNKHIAYGTGVVATLGTIIAAFGEVADGTQIQVSDLGIDGDKVFNNRSDGQAIKLARIDWSNGVQSVYLGGRDNNGNEIASDKMYDASQVDGVIGTIIYDIQDYHTSQKNYNHWVLYGASLALAYEIDPTHTVSNTSINTYAYTSQRRYDSFRWKALLLQSDTSGTLETGQEWQNGKFVIKKNGVLQGTSSRILIQIDLILDASNFNFKVDITGDKSIERIEGEDRSIYTSFYSLMSSTYSITFTDSSHVTNFQEFYWLLAADAPNNDGTGWTPGVGQDPNDYPNIVLGITGATCAGVRALLNQAGVSDVLKFIELFNSSGVKTTYASDIFWYLLLRIKVNYSFPSLLGAGTHTISVTTNQLSRTTSISIARDIGYFLLYDRTPLQYIGLAIYDNTIVGNGQFDFHYLNINSLDLLTGLTDGSNTNSVGLPNEYPSGIHLNATQKQYVQLPPFKTLEYAYQSNEEYWRDKVDSQGNAVLDRHLVPISLEHSDSGFPCLDLTSTDRDFAEITEINIENNKSYKFTILYNQVIDNGGNTFFGRRNSGNTAIGAFFNDSYYLILNSSPITVATDLDVSELRDFIHTVTFDVVAGNITNINFQIIKDGVVLSNKTTSDFTPSTLSAFDVLFAYSTNTAPTAAVRCKFSYAKIEVDNVLTHFWTYTGNNSLLLQDKIGGNHGTLTTANVALNQGTQDVFDVFEDGQNEFYYFFNNTNQQYIQVNYTKIDAVGEYFEVRFKPFSTGVVAASGSIYYIAIAGGTGYVTIYSNPSAQSLTTTNLLVNLNEWNVLRIEKVAIGFDITLNGVTENHTTIEHYWMAGIGAYSLASINGIFDYVDAGLNGYWRDSNNWVDEVNSNNGVIYNPVKTRIIHQHPYNGTDVFGNTLTTPRSKEVTKALKYTK